MLIQYHNVILQREEKEILNNVDFHVDNNDFIYIVGKVGSGKSSLLQSFYGELPVAEGEAMVLDFDMRHLKRKHLPSLRRKMGIIFQDFQLMHGMTVEKNLDFVLRATGWKKKDRSQRITEVLDLVNITDKAESFPHELSGGEQQRVCIARALLNKPQIILADEPVGNLDPETGHHIMQIFRSIREQGTAIVMVTHNLNLLAEYPGVVYRCEDGTICEATDSYNSAIELL